MTPSAYAAFFFILNFAADKLADYCGRTNYRSITEFLSHDEVGRVEFEKLVDVFIWAQRQEGTFPSNFQVFQDEEVIVVLCVPHHVQGRLHERHISIL